MGIVADGCSPYIISRCRIADSNRRRSVADTVIPYRNGRTAAGFGRIAHCYPIIGRNGRYTGILIVFRSRFCFVADSYTVLRVSLAPAPAAILLFPIAFACLPIARLCNPLAMALYPIAKAYSSSASAPVPWAIE